MQRVISSGILFQAVTYLDEVTEIVAIIIIIRALAKKQLKLSKYEVAIGVAFTIYFAFCTVSTIVNSYMGIFTSMLDAFVCLKFMVFYFAGKSLIASKALTLKKLMIFLMCLASRLALFCSFWQFMILFCRLSLQNTTIDFYKLAYARFPAPCLPCNSLPNGYLRACA